LQLYRLFSEKLGQKFLWCGRKVFVVDGTRVNLPQSFVAKKYKTPGKHAFYPQGLVSLLYDPIARLPVTAILSRHGNERKAAAQLLLALQPGNILVYDRGYLSQTLLSKLVSSRLDGIFRLPSQSFAEFRDFQNSGAKETQVSICRKGFYVRLRLIRYKAKNTEVILATTLLDSEEFPAAEVAKLYGKRWRIEEAFKRVKHCLNVEKWHSKSVKGVRQELFISLIKVFLINLLNMRPKHIRQRPSARVARKAVEKLLLQTRAQGRIELSEVRKGFWIGSKYRVQNRSGRSFPRVSRQPIGKFRLPRKKRARLAKAQALLAETANVP